MKKNSVQLKTQPKNIILTITERENIRLNSYIGKKGYTIIKSVLPKGEEEFLKQDLFMKPFVPGAQFGNPNDQSASFPVYRENTNKMYLPRFYGIQRYGLPDRCDIEPGDDIDVPFQNTLRDYQIKIVDIYCNYVSKPLSIENAQPGGGGILEVPCGRGKCTGLNTPIMMYDGTIKMVQDIKVGDVIMGDDSTPRNVLTLARGREQMYKVIPNKGDSYTVNESHILSLKYSSTVNKNTPKGTIRDISVLDYLNLPKSYHGKGGVLVGYRVPITFPTKEVDIDPYILGYWLGDGDSNCASITTEENEVVEYFQNYAEQLICKFRQGKDSDMCRGTLHYSFAGKLIDNKRTPNILLHQLKKLNLIQNKHIPHDYKCNDRTTQLELLAGIIDSDGSVHDNCYDIIQKNERLLDDIIFIARSLGFAAYKKECKKSCMYKGEKKEGTYYRTCIHGKGLDEIPVKCPRKKVTPRKQIKDALSTRIKIEKLEVDDYYGFEIDGNRRFVLGDCTVTHNTIMALNIISKLKKKTLILVHKEFLMNQWIERMNDFLPTARIGKIQGPVFDIEDKDVVIGMIQSLYDKEYSTDAFSSFGLTIIDEVHRIGSEQFSRTLFKTITPYMLGISATVERKDKLTKVLYMFIGGKIYEEKREEDDPVCVRAIEYKCDDPDFNEVELDYRGNTKFSSMIVKLCAFGPRSDFIVRVLSDLLIEHPENQIMILCQNKSLLVYLYEAINHREFASVGYYIGGMKQVKLQETEKKQIVLATYAMAAEALDIKTLATLVMVSPKTDIVQSVGRILRVKHKHPIIVDIVDMHENFQKQWLLRKRYYKKCNYRIKMIDSNKYTNMSIDWETDKTWKNIYEPKNKNDTDDKEDNNQDELPRKCLINFDNL